MSSSGNIYGIDFSSLNKIVKEYPTGTCWLCGRDHSKDVPVEIVGLCSKCKSENKWKIMPHCPGGVSHGEVHKCSKCNYENFIVIYWDGNWFIQKEGAT